METLKNYNHDFKLELVIDKDKFSDVDINNNEKSEKFCKKLIDKDNILNDNLILRIKNPELTGGNPRYFLILKISAYLFLL